MEHLYKKLSSYGASDYYAFHMPGHKRNMELMRARLPYNIDITEIDGFDDLHHAEGLLKELQENAARVFQAEETHYLVNGSTVGLLSAVQADAVSHAYILNGERGSGKRLLANLFAMSLQCQNRAEDGEACGKCQSCKQAQSGNQPDIIKVTHEKPNTISVDDIRTQVNNDIVIKPYSSKYKIYIIPEADLMSAQAQNALLKTIEEPPEYAVIMLQQIVCNSILYI